MTHLYAAEVVNYLFPFTQMAFADSIQHLKSTPFSNELARHFFTHFANKKTLTIKEILSYTIVEKRALYEILNQYITFLTMFSDLPFPSNFLEGTNELQLGAPLLAYFSERAFPFPQKLPQ